METFRKEDHDVPNRGRPNELRVIFTPLCSFNFVYQSTFLNEHLFPKPPKYEGEDPEELEKAKKINMEVDEKRLEAIRNFLKPGSVGVKYKSDYEAIKRGLKLKKDVKKDLGILGDDEEGDLPENKAEM